MNDNEAIKLFCTEWLLENECSRGSSCIFIHANMRDVKLCDDLTEEEVFVKGSYNHGWQKKVKNKRGRLRNQFNPRLNNSFSHNRYRNNQTTPSTSNQNITTTNLPSSSTGACKKVIDKSKKQSPCTFTSPASESEDENSQNLPNLQHSRYRNRMNACEHTSKNTKYELNNIANDNSKKINNVSNVETAESLHKEPKQMDVASALPDSQEKVCGICFEIIMQKSLYERRFGILPNCNHCFCLTCIRKWRQAKQFENNIIRACPECRVTSDFICPSTYWVETDSTKEALINNYKQVLSTKDCKYFKKGHGSCQFGNKCFYLHALSDGTKIDVGPPPSQRLDYFNDEMEILQKLVFLDYFHGDILDEFDDTDDDDEDDENDDELFEYMCFDSDDELYLY